MKLPSVSWKSVVGFLSMLSGVVTAVTVGPHTLPPAVETALVASGGVILAVERWAEAVETATGTRPKVTRTVVTTTTSSTTPVPVTGSVADSGGGGGAVGQQAGSGQPAPSTTSGPTSGVAG